MGRDDPFYPLFNAVAVTEAELETLHFRVRAIEKLSDAAQRKAWPGYPAAGSMFPQIALKLHVGERHCYYVHRGKR